MEVKELKHPLIEHKLAILRDKKTGKFIRGNGIMMHGKSKRNKAKP